MDKDLLFLMRRKKKITLKQLSEACNCSVSLLSLWENDKCSMNANKIQKYKEFITQY